MATAHRPTRPAHDLAPQARSHGHSGRRNLYALCGVWEVCLTVTQGDETCMLCVGYGGYASRSLRATKLVCFVWGMGGMPVARCKNSPNVQLATGRRPRASLAQLVRLAARGSGICDLTPSHVSHMRCFLTGSDLQLW